MYDMPDLAPGYHSLRQVLRDLYREFAEAFPPDRNDDALPRLQELIDQQALEGAGGGERFPKAFVAAVIRVILALGLKVEGVRNDNGAVQNVPVELWNSKQGSWMVMTARYLADSFDVVPEPQPLVDCPAWMNLRISDDEIRRLREHFSRAVVAEINLRRFEKELPTLLPADPTAQHTKSVYHNVLRRFLDLNEDDRDAWPVQRLLRYFEDKLNPGFSPRLFNEARTQLTGRDGKYAATWGKSGPKRSR